MRKLIVIFTLIIGLMAGTGSFNPVTVSAASTTASITADAGTPDILVPAVQGPTASQRLITRARASWPWYITRAAGLVAATSMILLMLSGIGLITGATFKLLEPLTAWATHRALGLVFGVSVVIHIVALLFDRFVPFTIAQALVPFASNYRSVTIAGHHLGSLYVAFGIFSLYAILAIIISSLLWIDKKSHLWKAMHFLSYLVAIFVFFHVLYLGTDLAHGVFRVLWIIFGTGTAIAILYRLGRAHSV